MEIVKEEKMRNRIVLVGNGFDLAHGLKSSYGDFLFHLFKKNWEEKIESSKPLETLSESNGIRLTRIRNIPELEEKIKELFLNTEGNTTIHDILRSKCIYINHDHTDSVIRFEIDSMFLKQVLQDYHNIEFWSDFESAYFKELGKVINHSPHINPIPIFRLNQEFENLKIAFIEYLKREIPSNKEGIKAVQGPLNEVLLKIINNETEQLGEEKFFQNSRQRNFYNKKLENVYFINFNYTSILSDFLKVQEKEKNHLEEIHIHGKITRDLDTSSIVFGYGDDQSKLHSQMELSGDNQYLKYQKSSYYGQDESYQKILYAMEKEFDVVVLGHSLGLSDRLLLNSIMEHDNCAHIHLCYRNGKEGHSKARMNLSRHFNNKIKMRERLFQINNNLCLPS